MGYSQWMLKNGQLVNIGGGDSSSGNVDYSTITGAPIKNAYGSSQSNFVNLSGLDYGHYNLSGYYKLSASGEVQHSDHPIDVYIIEDAVTGNKVAVYAAVENGEYVTYTNIYSNGTLTESYRYGANDPPTLYYGEF